MLSEKQAELMFTDPKAFLQQYERASILANAKLQRAEFWQERDPAHGSKLITEHVKELITEARELMTVHETIAELIGTVKIKESYREFLRLRFIECLTIQEISERLRVNMRWTYRLQDKALRAFADSLWAAKC